MKKSDKTIVLMLIGILLAAASYFLVYQKLTEQTEIMVADNAVLRQEVEYLQELADNKQQYIDDTASMQAKIEEIKAQFPAQYLPEDDILYMINTENTHDALARTISMSPTSVIEVEAPAQEMVAETTETEDGTTEITEEATAAPAIMLYRTPVSVTVSSSYNSMKEILKQINTDKNRKSVDTVSVAFDAETGELLSNISMSMYSLTGTEAEYTKPKVDGVAYGTQDIFNSAKKKAASQIANAQ